MKCTLKNDGIKAVIDVDGKTVLPSAYMTYCVEKENVDEAKRNGIKLFMFPIYAGDEGINAESGLRPLYPNFFKGYGEYDFSVVERLMEIIDPAESDAYVIPRVCIEPPLWWQRANPDELAKDHRGETQRECFVSEKWRNDLWVAFQALIDWFEKSPWRDRVIGYHIAAGGTEEWTYQSRYCDHFYDYSACNLAVYRKYLQNKYGTPEALSRSWRREISSFDDVTFPKPVEWVFAKKGFLRGEDEMPILDFFDYHNDAVAETILWFCKKVKDYTQNERLTGAFYGYVVTLSYNKKGLHSLNKLLNSPYIDFISTTNTNNSPGGAWFFSSTVHSALMHGKMWIAEGDIRTCKTNSLAEKMPYACPDNDYYGSRAWIGPENLFLSCSALKKALSRALTAPCGIWWFDMFGGWFRDDEMYAVISRMAPLYRQQQKRLFTSEIALIIDEKSYKYLGNNDKTQAGAMSEMGGALSHCGAPYDGYLQSDLADERFPADRYKLFIMATSVRFSEEERAAIRRLQRDGKTFLWLYASGFYAPDVSGFSLRQAETDATEQIEYQGESFPGVRLHPVEFAEGEDGYVVARYKNSRKPAVLWKDMGDWQSVHCLAHAMSPKLFRQIALMAGVHLFNLTDDVIYAGGEFVAIHVVEGGYRRINLPYADCRAQNAITGEELTVNDRFIDLKLEKYDTVVVHVECDEPRR